MEPPYSATAPRKASPRGHAKSLAITSLGLPKDASWPEIRATIASFKAIGCQVAHDVEAQITDLLDGAQPSH